MNGHCTQFAYVGDPGDNFVTDTAKWTDSELQQMVKDKGVVRRYNRCPKCDEDTRDDQGKLIDLLDCPAVQAELEATQNDDTATPDAETKTRLPAYAYLEMLKKVKKIANNARGSDSDARRCIQDQVNDWLEDEGDEAKVLTQQIPKGLEFPEETRYILNYNDGTLTVELADIMKEAGDKLAAELVEERDGLLVTVGELMAKVVTAESLSEEYSTANQRSNDMWMDKSLTDDTTISELTTKSSTDGSKIDSLKAQIKSKSNTIQTLKRLLGKHRDLNRTLRTLLEGVDLNYMQCESADLIREARSKLSL